MVYGGILLKPRVNVTVNHGRIVMAHVGGDYLRYAFEGNFQGRDLFVIAAVLHFDGNGQLTQVDGENCTDQRLIDEFRRTDRVIRRVN